ncbi:DMT family transporter [Anaerosporobacter faecicola]|uniref:DMT family transporter n=1 Tax=Anaerosporobacter faecicola TaxID=2718714 RepID=UPI0014390DFB|nr:DMT family transporter [Anaerosporobacter faecicola]
MIQLLAILNGILITTMTTMNGDLAAQIGNYHATVFIHLSGLLPIAVLYWRQHKRTPQTQEKIPLYLYSGGIIGVLTVVFTNVAINKLGVTVTLGICLFAQTVISLIFDHFGLLGMKKHPFNKHKLIGLSCICLGIFAML